MTTLSRITAPLNNHQSTHHEPRIAQEASGTDTGVGLGLNIANNSGSKAASSLISNKPASPLDIRIEPSQTQLAQRESGIARGGNPMVGNNPEVLYPSRLNRPDHPQTHISTDLWAITLIRAAKRNHSQLVIEGVENNQQFLRVAHFGGVSGEIGRVKYSDVDPQKLKVGAQNETHLIPRDRMQLMINEILIESNDSAREKVQNEQGQVQERDVVPITNRMFPRLYSVLGYDSTYSAAAVYVVGEGLKKISRFELYDRPSKTWLDALTGMDLLEKRDDAAQELAEQLTASGKWAIALQPDNCISWATQKMQVVGIDTPDTRFGNFGNTPQRGTNETIWKLIPLAIGSWFSRTFGSRSS